MKERWKSVVGFEGLYEVSDLGNVRSLNYNKAGNVKALKPMLCRKGYQHVELYRNGKKKGFYVHRLVYEAFRGPIPKGMVVNHLNEIKADNRLENLEVCTVKENNNWGTRNERIAKKLELIESEWPQMKLTFPSSVKASEFFGYKHKDSVASHISKARKRGENFIILKGVKYFFEQHQSGKNEALTKFSELT